MGGKASKNQMTAANNSSTAHPQESAPNAVFRGNEYNNHRFPTPAHLPPSPARRPQSPAHRNPTPTRRPLVPLHTPGRESCIYDDVLSNSNDDAGTSSHTSHHYDNVHRYSREDPYDDVYQPSYTDYQNIQSNHTSHASIYHYANLHGNTGWDHPPVDVHPVSHPHGEGFHTRNGPSHVYDEVCPVNHICFGACPHRLHHL